MHGLPIWCRGMLCIGPLSASVGAWAGNGIVACLRPYGPSCIVLSMLSLKLGMVRHGMHCRAA